MSRHSNLGKDKVTKHPRSGAAQNQNQGGGGGDESMHIPPPPPPPPDLMAPAATFEIMEQQTQALETLVNSFATQSSQANRPPSPPPRNSNRILDMLEELRWLNASEFGGSPADPVEGDDWLREMELKLEAVHTNERDRVTLAVLLLKGQALLWWRNRYREAKNPDAAGAMVWDEFVRVFRAEHVPRRMVKVKRAEFRWLRQEDMSVAEYLDKFTELSRYAPEFVGTDESRQEHFVAGLNAELRVFVGGARHQDFNAMVDAAFAAEMNLKELKQHKRKFGSNGNF